MGVSGFWEATSRPHWRPYTLEHLARLLRSKKARGYSHQPVDKSRPVWYAESVNTLMGDVNMKMLPTKQLFWIPLTAVIIVVFAILIFRIRLLENRVQWLEAEQKISTKFVTEVADKLPW